MCFFHSKATFRFMKPLGNVRGDITLQVTYNDVLGHQSLTPREPVESTPPYMYFYSIEMLCFWRPQCGKRAFLLHRKPTLSCIIFLEKIEETSLYRFSEEMIWQFKTYPHGSLSNLSHPYPYFDSLEKYRVLEPPSGRKVVSGTMKINFYFKGTSCES